MATTVESFPLALPERASAPGPHPDAPPWPGALRPGEGPRDPREDRPPVAVFGAGLAVWGLLFTLLLVRCAFPG